MAAWPTRSCWPRARPIGKSLAEPDRVDDARRILETAEKRGVRVVLPIDVIVAKEVTRGTEYKTLPAEKIPASWHIVDIGKASQELMISELADVETVFWNGPLGVFEIPRSRTAPMPSRACSRTVPRPVPRWWSAAATRSRR